MKAIFKTLALAGILFSAFTMQGQAMDSSSDYPKSKKQVTFEKNADYFKSIQEYYRRPVVNSQPADPNYPLTFNEKKTKQAFSRLNTSGHTTNQVQSFNRYTDASEYPLPHTKYDFFKGGWSWARNNR